MDVVYVLGNGSKWSDNEIRYSLRSVEMYLKDFNRIFIIGKCPDFLINITFIPCEDFGDRKERNIMEKIKIACNTPKISENFLFMNDDHFLLKPAFIQSYPYYYKDFLYNTYSVRDIDEYREALENTFLALWKEDLETQNFDTHCPIIYNKKKFLSIMNQYDWENKDFVIKSLYANSLKIKGKFHIDCKIDKRYTFDQLKELIERKHVFSIGDKAIRKRIEPYDKPFMRTFLRTLYPNKSKYERESETNEDFES